MSTSLTIEDLQYLIDHKMALRFQHKEHADKFMENGGIEGDAYSLSELKEWSSPDKEIVGEFDRALRTVVEEVFAAEMASKDKYDGEFLLLKDIESAHYPVTDRGYQDLHTIGAFTHITEDNVAARVPTTTQYIKEDCGFDGHDASRTIDEHEQTSRIAKEGLFEAVKAQIQELRLQEQSISQESPESERPDPVMPKGADIEKIVVIDKDRASNELTQGLEGLSQSIRTL